MSSESSRSLSWRTFLTPGWVIGTLLIIAFSYFAFTVLAPWQLNKNDAIVHRNEQIEQAFQRDPVPGEDVIDRSSGGITPDEEWTRISLTGHFLPDEEVLLRLRSVDGHPAYQALTPFRTDTGLTILVNRGYVTATEGIPPIAPAPADSVTLSGMVRLNEALPTSAPLNEGGRIQVYGINTGQVSDLIHHPLGRDYIQLTAGSPGELTAIPIPKLDRGSHLSYGLQWIAFGIMAPLGLGYFIFAEIRERRRVREEEDELRTLEKEPTPPRSGDVANTRPAKATEAADAAASTTPDSDAGSPASSAPASEDTAGNTTADLTAQTFHQRYGDQHRNPWRRRAEKKARER